MKILVIGNGAREHALAWKFSKSNRITGLYAAPGNAGTAGLATNLDIDPNDPAVVLAEAQRIGADLVFIGSEQPLAAGLADVLRASGIATFGPGASAARLESSKAFAREYCQRWGVPCAKTWQFKRGDVSGFKSFTDSFRKGKYGEKIVIKKSGLAAGKGVLETSNHAEALEFGLAVLKEDDLVAEEFLFGWEMSVFALCDESSHLTMLPCADHKKAGENDSGPNTGGMGAICPVPRADRLLMEHVEREIIAPSFKGMAKDKLSYRGVLFFGIMVTKDGPKLLEFNVRFGDPETQSLLPLIETDFVDVAEAVASGKLASLKLSYSDCNAVGVVIAAPGYPGPYPKGLRVEEIDVGGLKDALVFHASTGRDGSGRLVTGGGRCFTAVALADEMLTANASAYETARRVKFEGAWFRPDIGRKFYEEA
jgi:phosphoribosylamine---glycine ligase